MSEGQVPLAPQIPSHAEVTCAQCKSPITLVLPAFRVVNMPDVTMVVLVHEKAQICQKCGAGYVPVVRAISPAAQLDIQWSKVEYQQKPIIVPATPQQKNIIEKTKTRGLIVP